MAGVTTGVVRGVVVLVRDAGDGDGGGGGDDEVEVARWPLECPDTDTVDISVVGEVARLHVHAKRLGCRIRLEHLCPRVRELVELIGLAEVLG